MRKRRKLLLLSVGLAAVAALIIRLVHNPEPRYQGRTLSAWLIQAGQTQDKPAEFEAPRKAVLSIGTNALPYLLEWMSYPRPNLKSRAIHLLDRARLKPFGRCIPAWFTVNPACERPYWADTGFRILGPMAAPAIPELSRKLRAAPNDWTAYSCLWTLYVIGPNSIPALCEVVTNPPPKTWSTGDSSPKVIAVKYLLALNTNIATVVPVFLQALGDEDPSVASHAAIGLGLLGRGQAPVVPALTRALLDHKAPVRGGAADALGRLGAEARPAIPALLKALSDEHAWVRLCATGAVQTLAPEALTNAGALPPN